ncbi:MAG: ATP-binding cassette domain-containing protein [Microbacterium sp.]|uniref:ABC transporter ATP-binding protein n=1 Tax=Microbacterium sp. TaxID=51671 RepID=UPI003BB17E63
MTASPDDRTEKVTDAAPAAKKPPAKRPSTAKAPARRVPAKPSAGRTSARSAAEKAAATVEIVAEPLMKLPPEDTGAVAANAAAKTTAARSASAKSAKAAAAKSNAAKASAVRTAAQRSAAAKTAAKTTAARSASAKTTAAKAAAAKAAAAKAAAAKTAAAQKAAEEKAAEEKAAAEKAAVETVARDVMNAENPLAEEFADEQRTVVETSIDELFPDEPAAEEVAVGEPESEEVAAEVAPVVEPPAAESPVGEPLAEERTVVPADEPAAEAIFAEAAPEAPAETTDAPVDAASTDREDPAPVSGRIGEPPASDATEAIRIRGLVKNFGDSRAVNGVDLTVPAGSFYGIVGPNGAGKTTTLSIVAGLLRADEGSIVICGIDQRAEPLAAKKMLGVLPDRLRTFDRLTGKQLLYYYGLLRGLSSDVIEKRAGDLARAFDLTDALSRVVSDYSAGMTKKIMLAGALIHSPRVLVLDEPFEAVDPVSSAVILDILRAYVAHGGTVVLSSHGMDLVERVCSRVAIIVGGEVLAEGTIDEVRAGQTLEARFVELSGGIGEVEGLEWLHTFSA